MADHAAGRLKNHQPGEKISGRYLVKSLLGQGGFGSVYEVDDTQLKMRLACKEMDLLDAPDGLTGNRETFLQSFLREATALKSLHHPHIPSAEYVVVPCGQSICTLCGAASGAASCAVCPGKTVKVDQRHYLMMRFLDGETLEARYGARGRPLSWDDVKTWFLQVCSAVDALHQKGLIHRDIKPENVMLEKGTGNACLLDLGLVKTVDLASSARGNKTRVLSQKTQAIGTPGYAPPELYRGAAEPASDVFSLGMLLYWVLTNKNPADEADRTEMLAQPPQRFSPQIPAHVSSAIATAVKVRPNERFAGVAAFSTALSTAPAPKPPPPAPAPVVPRTTDLDRVAPPPYQPPNPVRSNLPAPIREILEGPRWVPVAIGVLIFIVSTGFGLLVTLAIRQSSGTF